MVRKGGGRRVRHTGETEVNGVNSTRGQKEGQVHIGED